MEKNSEKLNCSYGKVSHDLKCGTVVAVVAKKNIGTVGIWILDPSYFLYKRREISLYQRFCLYQTYTLKGMDTLP